MAVIVVSGMVNISFVLLIPGIISYDYIAAIGISRLSLMDGSMVNFNIAFLEYMQGVFTWNMNHR